jgi:hypothetical protein
MLRSSNRFAPRFPLPANWDVKNPFAKIDPPIQKEPQIRYLLLADIRRLAGSGQITILFL